MKRNMYGAMNTNYKSLILAISVFFALSASVSAAPGDLDPTFGNGGKRTDWAGYATGVAIQPDGKIVVVGDACCSAGTDSDFRVARYNPDGSPDTTFGGGTGRVTTDFNGENDASSSVVLQPDGKIIVAGWAVLQSGLAGDFRLAVVRYNPDGSLDTTFGGGSGKVLTPLTFDWVSGTDVAIQPNGRILVVFGQVENDYGTLIRYNADGSPDTSFGMGGYVDSELPIRSVTVQPADGKIVVTEDKGYGDRSPRIARFNTNGSLDTGFGSGGRVTLSAGFRFSSLAIDSAGKIVAAGASGSGSTSEFALFRFNVDGSPDSSFDGDGIVTTPSLQWANSIVIQSDGKIVAAGSGPGPGNYDLALARYNSNGSLDNTFGGGDGITTVDFESNNSTDSGAAVALDSQGRAVVVGGTAFVGGPYVFAIARFLGDSAPTPTPTPTATPTPTGAPGDLDPTFGNGKVIGSGYGLYDVAIQPDGKIVTVGLWAVARYNVDGSPDTTFGGTGRVFIDRNNQFGIDAAIQQDGKIVVATQDPSGDAYYGEIFRLNSDGSVDTSFGTNGIVSSLFFPSVAATLPDGKVLITQAGRLSRLNANGSFDTTFSTCDTGGNSVYVPSRHESVIQADGRIVTAVINGSGLSFGLVRCNPDGGRDTSFGSGGIVSTIGASPDGPLSIAIQTDGKIVVTGHSQGQLTVLRYHPNGALDSGFGTGGIATTPTGINTGFGAALDKVVIQTNGKIVVATSILNGSKINFGLVRFNPNGSLDTTFNGTGKVNTPITNGNDYARSIAIQTDGKFVVVGGGTNGPDLVVRYQGDSATCPNPIDCPEFFISQQYRDFLGREPDSNGLANWMATLTGCPNGGYGEFDNPFCDRIHVSAGFVQSHEFQGRGYWILRFGYVGLNRSIGSVRSSASYAEFTPALAQVGASNSPAQEEAAKVTYANAFVQRADFLALFPASMTAAQYVNALEANAQVTLPNKQSLIDALQAGTMSRADVLRNVVESQPVFDKYVIPAFVTMEYFGYLRRDPDQIGYQNWVNTLNANPSDYRHMIFGFIYSTEYRQRFGPV